MSSSSFESQRSIRSSTSIQSAASYKSGMSFSINTDFWFPQYIYGLLYNFTEILLQFYISAASNSSWFSIGSFSNFQAGGIVDPRAMNRAPRVNAFVYCIITLLDITQNRNLLINNHRILGPFSFISWQTKGKGHPFLVPLNTFC